MLDWFTVALLLAVGIILIVVELIFIPGTTLFGIAGLVLTIIGVVISFTTFGSDTGWLVLLGAFGALGVTLFFSLRTGAWDKVSLKTSNQGRVNEDRKHSVWKGDVGVALSALRPTGNVEFKETILEVSTLGNYVDAGSRVRVIEVRPNKILVEAIATNEV
jgi:membrane-bound ClpP family serine protease